jgi:hypothetical protein
MQRTATPGARHCPYCVLGSGVKHRARVREISNRPSASRDVCQTRSTSKVRLVDFGDCRPLQQPRRQDPGAGCGNHHTLRQGLHTVTSKRNSMRLFTVGTERARAMTEVASATGPSRSPRGAWASRMSSAPARPRLRRNTLGQRVDRLLEFRVFLQQRLDLVDGV